MSERESPKEEQKQKGERIKKVQEDWQQNIKGKE